MSHCTFAFGSDSRCCGFVEFTIFDMVVLTKSEEQGFVGSWGSCRFLIIFTLLSYGLQMAIYLVSKPDFLTPHVHLLITLCN